MLGLSCLWPPVACRRTEIVPGSFRDDPLPEDLDEIRLGWFGPDDPEVGRSDNSLAALAWTMGDYEEAEARLHDALAMKRRIFCDDHPTTCKTLLNLTSLLLDLALRPLGFLLLFATTAPPLGGFACG